MLIRKTSKSITIPQSRFKREANSLIKKLEKGEYEEIYITKCKIKVAVMVNVEYYNSIVESLQTPLQQQF